MKKIIAMVPGDGIGPDVVGEAVKVLQVVGKKYGHTFECTTYPLGGCSIDAYGVPMTDETLAACKASDSVLLGAVGGPKWDHESWMQTVAGYKAKYPMGLNPDSKRPREILQALQSCLGPNDIVATEVGQNQLWASMFLEHA